MKWEKSQSLQVGLAYQQTNRQSEFDFEDIDLTSVTMNAGVELEVVKKLFLLGNVFLMNTVGNEVIPVRDAQDEIVNFSNYSIDGNEMNLSGGVRFDFTDDIYVAAIYESNKNTFVVDRNYTYNQFLLYYIMKF